MSATESIEDLLRNAPLPLIAARVKRARKASFLSHDKLGERCGMYRANLINIEQGRTRPRLSTLERIASATGRDVRWFLDPEAEPTPFQDDDHDGGGD